MVAVFDTNILFSATAWRGNPYRCVELARNGKIEAVTCLEIMEELAEKLEAKLNFTAEESADTLADYLGFIRLTKISRTLKGISRDQDDDAIVECAVEAKADYIVTGDEDLLVLKEFRNIKIVRASEFLAVVAKPLA